MMGIKYLRVEAYSQRKPLVVLLGIGSNLGSHEGTSPLNVMIQDISRNLGMATVIAAGKQLVFIRFEAPTNGIWRIRVYYTQYLTGHFNMWLPAHNLISDETVFLTPSPYTTITLPGDSTSPITVGAYNHLNNSIYIHSGRGYTIGGVIKPDLAASGVNVSGPSIGRRNQDSIPMTTPTRTGTSVAAAHVAGAVANLLSWGIIEGHNMAMSEATIKAFLIRGAKRNPALSYPNREWGDNVIIVSS